MNADARRCSAPLTGVNRRASAVPYPRRYEVCSLLVAAAVLSLGACAYLLFKPWAGKIPGFEEVLASYQTTEAVLLDRHGDVVHELRVDRKHRRLDWVSLRDVSPALIRAVLAAEDRKFYEHRGVDWSAFGGSLREWVKQSSLRGASTISMQVASKLKEGLEPRNSRRSLWEKWRQIEEARELEKSWTKPQILEAYLNLVFFRGELQGIAAAARGLFDKSPHGLDECESLVLAALIRSPNAAESQVVRRSAQLADAMDLHLDAAEIARVANGALSGPYRVRPETALAPHVARRLLENSRTKSGPDSVRVGHASAPLALDPRPECSRRRRSRSGEQIGRRPGLCRKRWRDGERALRGWHPGEAPGGVDTEAVSVCACVGIPCFDRREPDRRQPARYSGSGRRVSAGELRQSIPGSCHRAHGARVVAQHPRGQGSPPGGSRSFRGKAAVARIARSAFGGFLRPLAGAGLGGRDALGPGKRLSFARRWRRLDSAPPAS